MTSNPAFDQDLELSPKDEQVYNGSTGHQQNNNGHFSPAKLPPTENAPTPTKVAFSENNNLELDAEAIKQKKRERKPLWFCNQISNWPKVSFGKHCH